MLEQADALQRRYILALDRRDLQGWADCFADPGSYVCATRENEDQGLGLGFMMDDSLARIKDRVTYINQVWAGTFEDYTTRHFVQRLECRAGNGGALIVQSSLLVAYTDTAGRSQLLAAGLYVDEITMASQGARFSSKKALLDTSTIPRYLVYPI
jgi:3-phenylpropionate/cinnamic acid dioxygenase small subunit